jgi:hypothetical protein
MALSAKEIQKIRNKYNVGSIQEVEEGTEKQEMAKKRIEGWKKQPSAMEQQQEVELQKLNPKEKKILEQASNISEKTFGKASEVLFGSTGKAVGGLFTGAIGGIKRLTGDEEEGKRLEKIARESVTPSNIAFSTLELLPTGGFTKLISKIPGGKALLSGVKKPFNKLSSGLKEKAIKLYTEALSPTTKQLKRKAEKVVPGLLEKKVVGGLEKIKEVAEKEIIKTGDQIEDVVEKIAKNKVETRDILTDLNNYKQRFIVKDVVVDPGAIKAIDEIENVVKQFGEEVDAEDIISLRRIWDKSINERRGFEKFADEITGLGLKVKKEATKSIRNVLAKESPELATVNKNFNFWSSVDDVVGATMERTKGQSGKLRERIGTGVGAIAGSSGGIKRTIIASAIGKLLTKTFNSPTWKTFSAVQKNNIADYLIEGNKDALFNYIKRIGIISKNELDKLREE